MPSSGEVARATPVAQALLTDTVWIFAQYREFSATPSAVEDGLTLSNSPQTQDAGPRVLVAASVPPLDTASIAVSDPVPSPRKLPPMSVT